ncbi:MAG: hypothetical protein CL624_12395 [Arcobacter sp.]|nr:hypothetical protein [Arcobacter sp.]
MLEVLLLAWVYVPFNKVFISISLVALSKLYCTQDVTKNMKYLIYFIIAGFILSFNGCGYKGDPVYINDSDKSQNLKEEKN